MQQSGQPSITSIQSEIHDHALKSDIKIETFQSLEEEIQIKDVNFEEVLMAKFHRLKEFVENLGSQKDSPISSDLIDQFEIGEDVYKNLTSDSVIHQTQKRIEKMIKTHKLKRNWSICDLKILVWLICRYCERQGIEFSEVQNYPESWKFVSSMIPGTTNESCLFKWLSLKRYKITLHSWSEEEEGILISLEKKYAESRNKWKYISEELYTLNKEGNKIYRHPKQCREHYASFLDPLIKKGPWTKNQDLLLLSNIIENHGEKKWCKLVKILEGRTQNAIKNRFQLIFTKLKRKKQSKNKTEIDLVEEYIQQNGGNLQLIKNQREQAVKNQTIQPPKLVESVKIQEKVLKEQSEALPIIKWDSSKPIIPNVNFYSNRPLPTVSFVPYQNSHPNFTFNFLGAERLFAQEKLKEKSHNQNEMTYNLQCHQPNKFL